MTTEAIFISGWAADSSVWDGLISRLPRQVDACCVPWWDVLECGADALPARDPDCLRIIVGWSLGGLLTLRLLVDDPNAADGMMLLGATSRHVECDGYVGVPLRNLKVGRRQLVRDPSAFFESFFADCLSPTTDSEMCDQFATAAQTISVDRLLVGWDALMELDFRDALPTIEVPTIVTHGEEDRIVSLACGRLIADCLPRAYFVGLADHGHALPICATDAIATQFRRLLEMIGGDAV